jgi:ER degradation enhancer, mannosidase alpha-like 1
MISESVSGYPFLAFYLGCSILSAVGPHTVRAGQVVYIDDPSLNLVPVEEGSIPEHRRHPEVAVSFFSHSTDPSHEIQSLVASMQAYKIIGSTALFGADLSEIPPSNPFNSPSGVILVRDSDNAQGCVPYGRRYNGEAILVHRGNCTFLEKLTLAKEAGASGVVVISDGEIGINPTAGKDELAKAGNVSDVALVVLTRTEGMFVSQMVDTMDKLESGQVKFIVHADHDDIPEPENGTGRGAAALMDDESTVADRLADRHSSNHILYLNGHPLLNTRLIF